jgi:hypothetical protein
VRLRGFVTLTIPGITFSFPSSRGICAHSIFSEPGDFSAPQARVREREREREREESAFQQLLDPVRSFSLPAPAPLRPPSVPQTHRFLLNPFISSWKSLPFISKMQIKAEGLLLIF